jgi:hypothetical protein
MTHAAHARKKTGHAKGCPCCQKKAAAPGPEKPVRRAPQDGGGMGAQYAAGPVRRLGIQTKLTVGRAGDQYEREADHVAERVATGQPAGEVSRIPAGGLAAQRQADEAPDDAQARAQREKDGEGDGAPTAQTQRKEAGDEPTAQRKESADEDAAQAKDTADDASAQRKDAGEDDKAQREEDAGKAEDAQAKCAACENDDQAQRQEDEGADDAQAQRRG